MGEPIQLDADRKDGGTTMFSARKEERDPLPVNAWAIAGLVVLVIAAAVLVLTHRNPASNPNVLQPLDPYAANLPLSQQAMSESTSLSGGKSTYLDGHIRNTGSSTVTAVTVQVLFRNDEGMSPAMETQQLSLIRTHEPYVDTQPVSAVPLKPGDDREFRLIFESVPTNWNTQMPEVHVIKVATR